MKKQFIVLLLIIILFPLSIEYECYSADRIDDEPIKNHSSLDQVILYDFNTTSTKQTFSIEIPSLNLDEVNCIVLYFFISDHQTDSDGLEVIFDIGDTLVEFDIPLMFQDSLEYNLTKSFLYPQTFSGPLTLLISCEGKTQFSYQSGTLQISAETSIEPVIITSLVDSSPLECLPDWVAFKGYPSSIKTGETMSPVYCNSPVNVNLSISFVSNTIDAFSKCLIVKINGLIVENKDFEVGYNEYSFTAQLNPGLNIITLQICVEWSVNEIWISNIDLYGEIIDLEDQIPHEYYDWVSLESGSVNHLFNISSLKPISSSPEQNLLITLDYGYTGVSPPDLYFEIISGGIGVHSGSDLLSSTSYIIDTYTTDYNSDIYFRIYGAAYEIGAFYLLNSSKIEIIEVSLLQENNTIDRIVVSSENYDTPVLGAYTVSFLDVLYYNGPSTEYNLSFSLDLFTEGFQPVSQYILVIDINGGQTIHKTVSNKISYFSFSKITLNMGYQEIYFTLIIIGEGHSVTLENLSYRLGVYVEEEPIISLPEDPSLDIEIGSKASIDPPKITLFWVIVAFDILALLLLFRHFNKRSRKESKDPSISIDETYEIHFDGDYIKKERFFNFGVFGNPRKVLLSATAFFVFLKILSFWLILSTLEIITEQDKTEYDFTTIGKIAFIVYVGFMFVSTLFWFSVIVNSSTNTFYPDLYGLTKLMFKLPTILFTLSGILLSVYIQKNLEGAVVWPIITSGSFIPLVIGFLWFGKIRKEETNPTLTEFFDNQQIIVRKLKEVKAMQVSGNNKQTTEVVKAKEAIQKPIKKLFCYHCNALLEEVEDGGPIVCLNCGKKTRTCEICKGYMVAGEDLIYILECGHIFHKKHFLEWMKVKRICPTCKEDFQLESIKKYYISKS